MSVTSTTTTISRPSLTTSSTRTSYSSASGESSFSCVHKIPNLEDILGDVAPEPYSLEAFTRYVTQNHCQEVLEFALDCEKYRQSYYGWDKSLSSAACKTSSLLHHAWNCMMNLYIRPDSAKEINISCSVREKLLAIDTTKLKEPVHPTVLDPALQQAKDLMKENSLFAFINNANHSSTSYRTSCYNGCFNYNRSSSSISSMGQQVQSKHQSYQPYQSFQQQRYKNRSSSTTSSFSLTCCPERDCGDDSTTTVKPAQLAPTSSSSSSSSSTASVPTSKLAKSEHCENSSKPSRTKSQYVPKHSNGHWRKMSQKLKFLNVTK